MIESLPARHSRVKLQFFSFVKLRRVCHHAPAFGHGEKGVTQKPNELVPLMTRLPEALRRRLEQAAAKSGRSMNGELIYRLQESFSKEDRKEETKKIVGLAVQQSTAAFIETLGPKLDALIDKRK